MNEKIVPALSFDALTPAYDFFSSVFGFGNSFKQKVVEAASIKDGENVVDIGSGTGTLAIIAKVNNPNSTVVGIDPDPRILKIAKQKAQKMGVKVHFVEGWAQKLPIESGSIDVVLSSLIFHHLPTEVKKEALKEIHRVLKPQGRFLLADFGKPVGFLKFFAVFVKFVRLPEAETMQDNINDKIPDFLKGAGFKSKEISQSSNGVRFWLNTK